MIFLSIGTFILPIRFLSIGFIYKIRSKEGPNQVSGFRTKLSLSSKKNWTYANSYASKLFIGASLIFILINIYILVYKGVDLKDIYTVYTLQVFTYIGIRLEVSRSLKKFEKNKKD